MPVANYEENTQSAAQQEQTSGAEPETQEAQPEAAQTEQADAPEQQPTELEKLQGEYTALNDRFLRLMAEFDNFRKRTQREKDNIYPEAVAATVAKFLPVLDNFERAFACETQDTEYRKGVELIYQAFLDTLTALKVEAFAQVGEPFQPELHNAVMHIEDENLGENVIAQVFQKGYKIGDRVVRHAMVQVAN